MRVKGGLNAKERKIFELIKNSNNPITSNELMKMTGYNKNAVQPSLRTLLEMGLIEVKDTVIENNIVTRRFVTTEDSSKAITELFRNEYESFSKHVEKRELFSALFTGERSGKYDMDELEELSKMLEEFKKKNV